MVRGPFASVRPLQIILAPECGLVVWWFPSFSPSSVIHAAGGRRTSEKASARMTEHISSFSTDFRIGSLPCVCARLLAGRRCWPNCHGDGRNGPLKDDKHSFSVHSGTSVRNMALIGRVHLKKTFCMSRVPAMFYNFSQILYRTQSFTPLDVAHLRYKI